TAARVDAVREEHQAPRVGGRETLAAYDEDRGFAEARRAGGAHLVQVHVVLIAKREGVGFLRNVDPVENSTSHETRALERLPAVRDDENRVLVRLEVFHQAAIPVLA